MTLIFLVSCGQTRKKSDNNQGVQNDLVYKTEDEISNIIKLKDKTVKFLWRANKYDEELKDTFNSIFINEDFCKTITDPEKAALGYVVTFIDSDCERSEESMDDFSNLKCKTLSALNLGSKCSDKHLGFLRKWFKKDSKSLKVLEDCPTVPYTASSQSTFDFINLTVKDNNISVEFGVRGINMRIGESWSYSETDYFQLFMDNIKLIKKIESKVKREHFSTED